MKVRRDIASVPVRSAAETWQAITTLITGTGSVDTDSLTKAASVMESLIADEYPAAVPIVVKGNGPRLVIYLLYNEDAMETGKEIDALTWNPTGGPDWSITAPSEAADIAWMNNTLQSRARRIAIHDVASPPSDEEEGSDTSGTTLKINWGVLNPS
jgi:hypothetical protein